MSKIAEVLFLDIEEKKELIDFAENVLKTCFKEEKIEKSTINAAILSAYLEQLVGLLQEILDPAIPFKEKV